MEDIIINGLNIPVTQTITGFKLINGRSIERTETGYVWNGKIQLFNNGKALRIRKIQEAISSNSSMTFEELNDKSQSKFGKQFQDLTVVEIQQVQGEVLAEKMISAINDANTGISINDVSALVSTVISSLS